MPDQNENPKPTEPSELTLPKKKKWFARPGVWVIIIAAVICLAGVATYGWYLRRAGYTKKMVSEGWHEISQQADKTVVLLNKSDSATTLGEASRELHSLDGLVRDKKYYASQVPTWLNDKAAIDQYKSFLDKYGAYATMAASQSDDVTILHDDDFHALDDASATAKTASEDLTKQFSDLTESMPEDIYKVREVLERVQQKEATKKEAEAKTKSDLQKKAEKDQLDAATVEANVSKFMDGFISADKEKMKRYMTAAYEKEYDFNQISAESRQYSYPASFRITDSKKDGSNYKVSVNVIYKYRDSQSQYTSTTEYTVIYSSQYNTWLINSQKYVN